MGAGRAKAFAAGALVPNMGYYFGFSLRETAGAAATVRLWDNASAASGTLLATIGFTANQSQNIAIGQADAGVFFASGIFVEVVAGTVEGSIYVG